MEFQLPAEASGVGLSRRLQISILTSDLIIIVAATFVGFSLRFSVYDINTNLTGPIQIVGTLIPIMWLALLVLVGAYDRRVLGLGLTEYGRVVKSALWLIAVVALVSFLGKFDTSRAYVLIAIPLGLAGLLAERWLWRRWILLRRRHGENLQTTVIVGDPDDRDRISRALDERPWAGYQVVAAMDGLPRDRHVDDPQFHGWVNDLMQTVEKNEASCIALTASAGVSGSGIRELSWRIEKRGIDLLISSSLGAIVGPRLSLRVATGLPFVHLDEVGLSLSQRIVKRTLDITGSAALLVLLSPILLAIAIAVALTSGFPILFRQERAGLNGQLFRMWKFRTMVKDADAHREALRESNDQDGPTLKIKDDPRITPVGRFLRRWSLDELPQLVNVLIGDMSLVGPRPHPVDDIERYRDGDTRRLLAKPGMTGMWQVAGRSDLSWQDAVELDLLYIENWSPLGDIAILARTVQAVITKSGAY